MFQDFAGQRATAAIIAALVVAVAYFAFTVASVEAEPGEPPEQEECFDVSAPDMTSATDSGRNNSDDITKDNTPAFAGGVAGVCGDIALFDGATEIGIDTTVSLNGNYSIQVANPLADGQHDLRAVAVDSLVESVAVTVTIDTQAPSNSVPFLHEDSDTGDNGQDNVTNDATPHLEGTRSPDDAVYVYEFVPGGALQIATIVRGTAVWDLVTGSLAEGNHTFGTRSEDSAGNLSPGTGGILTITLDVTAPSAPSAPDIVADSDTGVSNTDNLTRDNRPTFVGSAEAGTFIQIRQDQFELAHGPAASYASNGIEAWELADGVYPSVEAVAYDLAGNASPASSSIALRIDTVAPARPAAPDLLASSDTGLSNVDNATTDTTPTFTGATGDAVGRANLFIESTPVVSAAVDGGTWSGTPAAQALGRYRFRVQFEDHAGNPSAFSPFLNVVIGPLCLGEVARIFGGGAADTLNGTASNDTIHAGGGNDTVNGGGGNDRICGGGGSDSLKGAGGNDQFDGGAGSDTCNGGLGTDSAKAGCETVTNIP
jgi:Ca2+-binding RTX toxin-like protein